MILLSRYMVLTFVFLVTLENVAVSQESGSELVVSEVEKVADGFQFIEGPVWNRDGFLLFSDIPANQIKKWNVYDGLTVWRKDSGNSNGLTYDTQGRLLTCEHGNRRVSRTQADGSTFVIADRYDGKRLNSPNDCAVRSDGMIYFTDPDYGVVQDKRELGFNGVYSIHPGKQRLRLLARDFNKPNGIALSPDETILYVADTAENHVRAFYLQADGSVTGGVVFAKMKNPDGLKVDIEGYLYVTAATGVEVFNPRGVNVHRIEVPEQPANCGFGDADSKTLYITARKGLYKVRLKHAGISVWRNIKK